MTQPPASAPAPKAPLGPSRSLPSPAPGHAPASRPRSPPRLRPASSLTAVAAALWLCLAAASALALPSTATTLRFATQPPDRPLGLYRAPAPYQESGKRPLNSVIITSKPFSITQQLQATTPPPSPSEEARASSSSPSPSPSAAGSAQAWRRVASATTQRPQVTLSLPQYSIDCAEGLSCSETIAVDAATQPPTFKPYPQDVLDKFLRDFAHAQRLPDQHARPTEESVERATNRLANLYLEHEGAAGAEGEAEIEGEGERGEEEEEEEAEREGGETQGKSRWHLLSAQQHHHPYDDRDGWVSLEPVPWSTSKVAKWHATRTKRPHDHKPPNRWDARPPLDWDKPSRPSWVRPSYEEDYEPPPRPSLPPWPSRPAHGPAHGPAPDHHRPWDAPAHDYELQKPPHWPGASHGHDIITDNRPNRWPDSGGGGGGGGGGNGGYRPWEHKKPHYDYSHGGGGGGGGLRPSGGGGGYDSHRHPPSHPDESEGQWVLVSSTKGFAVPHRHRIFQRALAISAKPLTSRRTVRLTVLPALNGTANTTISHGGLLEVESTFQSVEEEQQQQELQHHLQHHRPAAPHYVPVHAPSYRPVQHQPPPPPPSLRPTHNDVTPLVEAVRPKTRGLRLVAQQAAQDSSRAVLAAVGAGMVPATLALMAPLVLGRRRRSPPPHAPPHAPLHAPLLRAALHRRSTSA